MKVLDRLSLIDRIGRELQSRMTFGEIEIYLKGAWRQYFQAHLGRK